MLDMPWFIGFLKVGKMAWRMDEIEALRIKYKPECITTLFVGESAPRSGDFFYSCKRTHFRTNIEEAIKLGKLRGDCDFFKEFKGYGWYLDDLVINSAIDKLPGVDPRKAREERRKAREKAAPGLTSRLVCYRPQVVVCLMLGIAKIVKSCVESAERQIGAPMAFDAVPFPGMGHQEEFKDQMKAKLPGLPRSPNFG